MRILTSSLTLDQAGVPTYTYTMVRELERRGHEVWVYSPQGGYYAKKMRTVSHLLIPTPDVIVAQHTPCAYDLKAAFPDAPFIFSAHGTLPDVEQPPLRIDVDLYTAINTLVVDHLVHLGIPADRIEILRDFVDTDRFRPMTSLRTETPRVLFISNYKKWRNHRVLSAACTALGYPLRCVGAPYGRSRDMVADINDADIVVSWGRGILEGMSCGRAVISYDKMYGDGYLTHDEYFASREHNFGYEYASRYAFDVTLMQQHLQQYQPEDGTVNRSLIERYHSATAGVDDLLRMIDRVCQFHTA